MTTLSVKITDELARAIENLAAHLGQRKEDLAASALEQHMGLVSSSFRSEMSVDGFEDLRRRLQPYAEAAGYTSEEEILDDIS
jgi:predicted DNA-binding protein